MKEALFRNPPSNYRMKTIIHGWPEAEEILMEAVKDFGYGGVATNPCQDNGYTSSPENLKQFDHTLKNLKAHELDYWIYDEKGYPSGYAGGLALEGHPELEARGFYMVRRIAYAPKHTVFDLDDESEKIIWAAKYPVDCTVMNASIIMYEKMEAVPFTDKHCECDLDADEAFFVFCVKTAYEGTHLTHNVCSRSHYINILDKRAVRRFIDVCYEPIAAASPQAYRDACAVFTDEPSLMTTYMHGDEAWPYALAPWVDGLFEAFEETYGYALQPYLPQIFEGRASSATTRVHFYELIGKLVADAYVTQLSDWCHAHGGRFSGHYLAEESLKFHVLYYGSYLKVLEAADYPGVDVLAAYPQIYHYNTTRFAQMAARKSGKDGVMAELCPFIDISHFEQDPVRYAAGILNLLYLGGCRCINSYFSSDFASYSPAIPKAYEGYMSRAQARWVNDYVGRMGYMLDQVQNDCGTFIYYALEDVQARTRPCHCAQESSDCSTDQSLLLLTRLIYENGHDYLFADRTDVVEAAKSGQAPQISGMAVKNIILPAMDVIWPDVWDALKTLSEAGVNIYFVDQIPTRRVDMDNGFEFYDFREESVRGPKCVTTDNFQALSADEVLQQLNSQAQELSLRALGGQMLLKARFVKDESILYFVVNNSEDDADIRWNFKGRDHAKMWDPSDGLVTDIQANEPLHILSYRGKFLEFERYCKN